jgi:hypothetical protein
MFWPSSVAVVIALILCLAGCGSHNRSTSGRGTRADELAHVHRPASGAPPGAQVAEPAGGDANDNEPHAATSQVLAVRSVAQTFFRAYVAFLYGRVPPSRVNRADPALRSQLEQGRATTTPAERAARPRIAHLTLSSSGPPISVLAVATITAGCCGSSALTATLEPEHGAWLIVAVSR